MGMQSMYELREMLCRELDELTRKGELGAGDLDIAHKLTDTIKNIDKIDRLEDEGYSRGMDYSRGRYSRDGNWEADMRGTYNRGNSYERQGTHYVRGHYSRAESKSAMRRQLQEMLDEADNDTIRSAIQRCMDAVEV
jgi:hypothetical protein